MVVGVAIAALMVPLPVPILPAYRHIPSLQQLLELVERHVSRLDVDDAVDASSSRFDGPDDVLRY